MLETIATIYVVGVGVIFGLVILSSVVYLYIILFPLGKIIKRWYRSREVISRGKKHSAGSREGIGTKLH